MSTQPGWADALGKQLAGDSDVWQRIRARKGSPFRHSAARFQEEQDERLTLEYAQQRKRAA